MQWHDRYLASTYVPLNPCGLGMKVAFIEAVAAIGRDKLLSASDVADCLLPNVLANISHAPASPEVGHAYPWPNWCMQSGPNWIVVLNHASPSAIS